MIDLVLLIWFMCYVMYYIAWVCIYCVVLCCVVRSMCERYGSESEDK